MASPANTPRGFAGPPVKGGQLKEDLLERDVW